MTAVDDVTPAELLGYIGRATDGSDVTAEEIAAFLAAGHDEKTQNRVLRWVSKVARKAKELAAGGEVEHVVTIRTATRGRVTGFSMACSCGVAASRLAASKRLAGLAAAGHLRLDHESVGRIEYGR